MKATRPTRALAPVEIGVKIGVASSIGVLCFIGALLAGGCAGLHADDPDRALQHYALALEEGRAEDAYRLLSEEARRGTSLEAFRKLLRDQPGEAKELAAALRRPATPSVVTATVTTQSGQELELVLERGAWKVDSSAVDLYAQDTARHAVTSFVRAIERKRYDVLVRFIPEAHRQGLDAKKLQTAWEGPEKDEVGAVVSAVKQVLPTARIEETGDHATLGYGSGTMQLVRESGQWKIEDFD